MLQLVPEIQRMRSTPGTADASLAAVYAAFLDQSSFTPSEVGQANSMWVVFAVWRHGYAYRATHGGSALLGRDARAAQPCPAACTPSGSCSLQALLNGNATQLSTLRLGDAKSIPAVDVMISEGFNAVADVLKQGLDIQYGAGDYHLPDPALTLNSAHAWLSAVWRAHPPLCWPHARASPCLQW